MPTGPQRTIIRQNVFIKNDAPSPDGDRPNLLVDGFPDAGEGSQDLYEIYGNLFLHNPRESLLQASGRVSIHDNLFVDVTGTAILLRTTTCPPARPRLQQHHLRRGDGHPVRQRGAAGRRGRGQPVSPARPSPGRSRSATTSPTPWPTRRST